MPKRTSRRQRQTKLSFSPVSASSAGAAKLSPQVRERAATVTFEPSPSRASKKRKIVDLIKSESESDVSAPARKKSQHSLSTPSKEVKLETRQGSSQRPSRMFGNADVEPVLSSSSSSGNERQEAGRAKKSKHVKRAMSRKEKKVLAASSETESDAGVRTRGRNHRGALAQQVRGHVEEVSDDGIVESDLEVASSRVQDRRRKRRRSSSSEEEDVEAEAPEAIADESDEHDAPRHRKRLHRRINLDEKDDLEEDLEFLRSSPPATLRRTRTDPKSERQRALAALKARRAAADSPSSAPNSSRNRMVIPSDSDDSDSDLEIIKEKQEASAYEDDSENAEETHNTDEDSDDKDEGESEGEEEGRRHSPNAHDVFQENADDEGFIDDDEEGLIGEPSADLQLPLAFSSLGRAKASELFKYAVDWMVQKKINPAFPSNNEIYQLTFRKLDDEVKGLASSKYSSAAWTPEFTRTLRARPEIFVNDIAESVRSVMSGHCEACNRKTHPATFNITFSGQPYNTSTLEPLADDSESTSDSDESSSLSSEENGGEVTYDAQGEIIASESRVFDLGSTCKANAQIAHTLFHWRHHLYSWVVDYLERMGHLKSEKLVEREKMSVRKREKQARKIVKSMEKEGKIKELHRLYKDQVNYAIEVKNDYNRGWGRR